MTKYSHDGFFYDSVKIREINMDCYRYADCCLWENEETTDHDTDNGIVADRPPMSTYDIALLQVTLSQEVDYFIPIKPVTASVSVGWKSDYGDFVHHIVRFDMENCNADLAQLTEQRRIEWRAETKKMRGIIDRSFDHIKSTYTAHHLGWLNVPLKTVLYGLPEGLCHISTKIKLPKPYGTLFCTLVSTTSDDTNNAFEGFNIEEVMNRIDAHFTAFAPKVRC